MQETLLAAWRGLDGFEGRASLRTWLYRIATNRCLNALRDAAPPAADASSSCPSRPAAEPTWLGPTRRLLEAADAAPAGGALRDARGGRPRVRLRPAAPAAAQRAVLVLRDVLGFRAAEVAEMLDTQRGRRSTARCSARGPRSSARVPAARARAPLPRSPRERALVDALRRRLRGRRRRRDRRAAHRRRVADDAARAARVPGPDAIGDVPAHRARRAASAALPARADARQRPARVRALPA